MNQENSTISTNKDIFLKSLITILDAQDAVIYVADMETYEVLYVNEKARELFGDVVGKICWQTLQKDQQGPCPFCTNKYLVDEHGQPTDVHVWEFQNTITGQWFELRDRAIKWADGRIVRLEIGTDISDSKKMEKKVRETQGALEALLNSITETALLCDPKGNVIVANETAARRVNTSKEKLIGTNIFNLMPEDATKSRQTASKKVVSTKQPIRFTDEREGRHFDSTIYPVLNDEGVVDRLAVFSMDITERKQVEEALRESRERLNLIIERMPTGCIMWNPEFHVELWNPVAEAIFGYKRDEALGKHAFDLIVDPEVFPHVNEVWRRLISGDSTAHSINENRTKDGRVITCEWYNTPLNIADGTVIGVISMVHDVTARIDAETKIKQSLEEKKVLLKEIHHRVKNNMAVISAMLSLQAKYARDAKITELLRESQSRIESMALVHEKLYKSEDFTHVDVKEYAEALARHITHVYRSLKNTVDLVLDIDDISLELDVLIPCGLIINELVTNSYKHAFTAQEHGEIRIEMHPHDSDKIKLEISDNGSGLPEEYDIGNLTSMGFNIVHALVSQLHGTLQVDGATGTRYTIVFPVKLTFAGRAL